MSTYVVGLDLSLTASGIGCILDKGTGDPPLVSTHVVPSSKRPEQTLLDLDKRITRVVNEVIGDYAADADLICLEGPSYASTSVSAWDRGHLWWSVVHRVHSREIPLVVVPPKTVKKWATDKGNASKIEVAIAMARMWPEVDLPDDNAADALALATIGAQRLGLVPALARHRAAVAGLDWPESLPVSA